MSEAPTQGVRRFVPVRNGTAFSGMKQLGDASTWDDELEPYVRWSDYERLTAALATCQTYDYRTLADEVGRLEKALALQVEQEAANWRRGEDERNRLREALENFATMDCMHTGYGHDSKTCPCAVAQAERALRGESETGG